jgi:formylmethanofuran dehydrogenase subunit E
MTDPRTEIKTLLKAGNLSELLIQSAQLHGHYCPGLAYGVKAGFVGLKHLGFENTGMEELIAIVECNNCFVDGIQMTTGCTMGNNALVYKDIGKTAVTILSRKTNSAVRISLKQNSRTVNNPGSIEKEASKLADKIVKQRISDSKSEQRLKVLYKQIALNIVNKNENELFNIAPAPPEFPEYAPIVNSLVCGICKEEFMETKNAGTNKAPICLSCAKDDCHALLGRGICVLKKCKVSRPKKA